MSLQTESSDKRLKSLQSEVQTLRSLVRCPICLETMTNPVRTKCDHGFCRFCLEKWILEKGKRGRVNCPSCQAEGVTKRSLKDDLVIGRLVGQIRRAFTALNEDTHRQHEPHFLLTTEVPPTQSTAEEAGGDGKKRSPLVSLVEDYTAKILKENNKSPPPPSPASSRATRPPVWNKEKDSGRKTYGAKKAPGSSGEMFSLSPIFPGEEVVTDWETERRLTLPLVGVSKGGDKVGRWLEHSGHLQHQDINSQPTPSQSSVSTPVSGRGRTESIRSMAANSSPLSPISLNVQSTRELKGSVDGITPRKDPGDAIPSQSQSLLYNCSVDVQDTFDKLLLTSSSKSKRKLKKKDCSPTLSPRQAEIVTKDSDNMERYEDMEDCEVKTDEINTQTEENQNLPTNKSNDKTLNENNIENTIAMDFEDDVNIVNDVSINHLLDWQTQDNETPRALENPSIEANLRNNTVKIDDIEKETQVKNVRSNVPFSLVGKVAHSVRPPRDRVFQYLQLGRLASPRTRKFSWPSLKDIVEKKNLFAEVKKSEKQEEEELGNKNSERDSESPEFSGLPAAQPVTQCRSEETDQESPLVSDDDLPPLLRMEPSFPENRRTWLINDTVASLEENQTDTMENLMGDDTEVYGQEAETGQEMKERLPRPEFGEEEVPVEKKRARSEDSNMEDSNVIFTQRKVARIDSDSESADSEIPGTQQPVVERPRPKRTVSRTVTSPESSSSQQDSIDFDSETGEKMNTQQMEEKCRQAELRALELRETMAGQEEQEVFQRVEESQPVSDSESDMFSLTPEKNPAVRPSRAPGLSPVPEGINNTIASLQENQTEFMENILGHSTEVFSQGPARSSLPETKHWKFVLSNVSEEEKAECEELIESLDCLGLSEKVDESVTHLIITTGADLKTGRTLKYLQAVASGVLIVSQGWVAACLQDRAQLARAEDWEVTDQDLPGCNGPWRSRKRREEGRPPLLSGYEVMVEGDLVHLPSLALNDLLARVGARKVLSVNSFSFTRTITRIIIVNSSQVYGTEASRRRLRRERLAVVDKDWLLDTISSHSLRPLKDHTAEGITEKELSRAGYSSPLVEVD